MKTYGMIKASRRGGGGRVNPIVALEVSPDAEWPELQAAIDAYCAEQGLNFIAFVYYGTGERGRARFEEYQTEQQRKHQEDTRT